MNRMKIKFHIFLLTVLALAALLLITGCGDDSEDYDYYAYYLNTDSTNIESIGYEPESETAQELIEEFITLLTEETNSVDYRQAVTGDVEILDYELENNLLRIYFNSAYYDMETSTEVLVRGAVVHTMLQIEDVSAVMIYVDGETLVDAGGEKVGLLTNDSFVENPGEQINSIQETQITLYFANEDGDALVTETQHIYYSSNISLEKLIMERLIEGPQTEGAQTVIPEGTTLVNVSVMDGVAFVNFDDTFLTQNYEISENIVIYSIVNSLTELSTVDKVQISVNGETNMVYRDSYSLSEVYTQDLTLLDEDEADPDEEDEGESSLIDIEE